jgi:hypothetical protein
MSGLETAGVFGFEAVTMWVWLSRGLRLPPRAGVRVYLVFQAAVIALYGAGVVSSHDIFSLSAGIITSTIVMLFIITNIRIRLALRKSALALADQIAYGIPAQDEHGNHYDVPAQSQIVYMRWQIPRAYWATGFRSDNVDDGPSYHAITGTYWLKCGTPDPLQLENIPYRRFRWREVH